MKAIFVGEWDNGTLQLPEGIEIAGVSMYRTSITDSGIGLALITAEESVIEALKTDLVFVKCVEDET